MSCASGRSGVPTLGRRDRPVPRAGRLGARSSTRKLRPDSQATAAWLLATVQVAGSDAMPFATTTSVQAPASRLAGASNWVDVTTVLPSASTPMRLWLWVRP